MILQTCKVLYSFASIVLETWLHIFDVELLL